jgi:hypothetical protein
MKRKLIRFAAAILLSGGMTGTAAQAVALPAAAGYQAAEGLPGQGRWDAPPAGLSKAERRGYRAGVEGARKDFENHRRPNVNNRKEYRHPHVKHHRKEYKEGFRRGYEAAMEHLTGGAR